MINDSLYLKALELHTKGIKKAVFVFEDGRKEKLRLGKTSSGQLLYLIPHSKTRGQYLNDLNGLVDIQPIIQKEKSALWLKSINKAISLLRTSGLWQDKLEEELLLAKEIGFEKIQQAYKITNEKFVEDYYKNQAEQVKRIKELEPRLVKISEQKENKGTEYYDTSILWYFNEPLKIKKMYFGKYSNALNDIAKALKKKEKLSISGRTNYDISFEYNPTENKAWYSEEYKNCGNGHYYLALSATHALYYEDD